MSTTAPTPTSPARPQASGSRPSLARLTVVELRKVLDTGSGRWFLAAVVALAGATLANHLVQDDGSVLHRGAFSDPTSVLRLLLPVLGVLAMTGEWTQRTALTTFALVPRRGRVLPGSSPRCSSSRPRWCW